MTQFRDDRKSENIIRGQANIQTIGEHLVRINNEINNSL